MGLRDLFKKKNAEATPSYTSQAKALGGVHEIIASLWDERDVKRVIAQHKEEIASVIAETGVRRKTELLEYGLNQALASLAKAKQNPKLTLSSNCITAFIYYRFFFECALALDDDIIHVTEWYTIFQATKVLNPEMHSYVQTMIKIYDLLDRGIIYHYEKMFESKASITDDYFAIVANKIRIMLNAYTDDNTDWNKITI